MAGSFLEELADIRWLCARRGIDCGELELWQIAAVLGVHRPEVEHPAKPSDPFDPISNAASDPVVAEMKRLYLAEQETGEAQEWGPPTAEEQAAIDALFN